MRRALVFCWWCVRWWVQLAEVEIDTSSYITEGRCAYAIENSAAEQQRAISWATKWAAIRARAHIVLSTQLSTVDVSEALPELVIELNDEDEGDLEQGADDAADDDDEADHI